MDVLLKHITLFSVYFVLALAVEGVAFLFRERSRRKQAEFVREIRASMPASHRRPLRWS